MSNDGRSPDGSGYSAEPEPSCTVSAVPVSIPNATSYSFCWQEPGSLEQRAVELVRSMAAVKCRNKYPVGVIGAEARSHYTEARRIVATMKALQSERTGA